MVPWSSRRPVIEMWSCRKQRGDGPSDMPRRDDPPDMPQLRRAASAGAACSSAAAAASRLTLRSCSRQSRTAASAAAACRRTKRSPSPQLRRDSAAAAASRPAKRSLPRSRRAVLRGARSVARAAGPASACSAVAESSAACSAVAEAAPADPQPTLGNFLLGSYAVLDTVSLDHLKIALCACTCHATVVTLRQSSAETKAQFQALSSYMTHMVRIRVPGMDPYDLHKGNGSTFLHTHRSFVDEVTHVTSLNADDAEFCCWQIHLSKKDTYIGLAAMNCSDDCNDVPNGGDISSFLQDSSDQQHPVHLLTGSFGKAGPAVAELVMPFAQDTRVLCQRWSDTTRHSDSSERLVYPSYCFVLGACKAIHTPKVDTDPDLSELRERGDAFADKMIPLHTDLELAWHREPQVQPKGLCMGKCKVKPWDASHWVQGDVFGSTDRQTESSQLQNAQ